MGVRKQITANTMEKTDVSGVKAVNKRARATLGKALTK